jgi:amidophosphoribosyltransferase
MATKTDFVASDRTVAEITDKIGADYLMYLDLERMNAAARAGNPKVEKFCNACFTGEYPTGDVTREMLTAIETERSSSQAQLSAWS